MSGPFQQFPLDGGSTADLYLLRYDQDGGLRSPLAEQEIKDRLAGVGDVFLFSHGWNNVFAQALDRYRGFIGGFIAQRQQFAVPVPPDYKPLLIGVVWPSTSFLMPWEAGPKIAADPEPDGPRARQVEEMLGLVTGSLGAETDPEFVELVDGRSVIDADAALRAAEIVLGALRAGPDPDDGSPPPTAEEFLTVWAALDGGGVAAAPADPDDFGVARGASSGLLAAGGGFDPRNLLRAATVWKMKARAGEVGSNGVGPLVAHILRESGVRLHLVGHSFGAKVLLSALAVAAPSRPARSMLLLQAAVNRWCFAADVAGTGRPGGYHAVLDLVDRPLLTTFSAFDEPLTKVFHLAMRGSQLGEPGVAAFGDPELYGALGGFGPAGVEGISARRPAAVPGRERYDLGGALRVIAVDGGVEIDGKPAVAGHGEISNPATWWAMHALVRPD
ncbi:hypothetical protein [Embleya scabrispora]|uniref:hypothetical protein n=1 Tax=Embleya scabrispora TaxID=159449 RepID=UPI0003A69FF7|nr:hypothetical protein [Embleya scabrispora]MYS84823.1 hypothetical protein [Streptomyces sp. SID5474]